MPRAEVFANSQERKGEQKEVNDEVRPGDDGEEFPERVKGSSIVEEKGANGDSVTGDDPVGDLFAQLPPARELEFLVLREE